MKMWSLLRFAIQKAVFLAAVVVISQQAHSEIFKWVDENGKVHFSDQPNPNEEKKAEKVELSEPNSFENVTPPIFYDSSNSRKSSQSNNNQNRASVEECENAELRYRDLTTVTRRGRVLDSTALAKEGKTLSRKEQNKLAEQYRIKMNKRGCSILQMENIKL